MVQATSEQADAAIGHPGPVHVMLDLETWGTLPGSALRSIGAVTFSPEGFPHDERVFYTNIDRASCEAIGLTVDLDTVAWWAKQSEAAQARLNENCRPFGAVARDFAVWWQSIGATFVWSNGANFDEVLWRMALRKIGLREPWKYWNVRDTRTCWHLAGIDHRRIPFQGTHHDALADARHQAKCVTLAFAALGTQASARKDDAQPR